MLHQSTIAFALLLPTVSANAGQLQLAEKVGATYEILQETKSSQTSSDKSLGNSMDRNGMLERVIGVREDGLLLEYDLPKATKAEDRARYRQFPVQILKPVHGNLKLVNRPELEAWIDVWLKAANIPRSACGHWIFTWTAIKIECDPQSVIHLVSEIDLRSNDLRDGAMYNGAGARALAPLKLIKTRSNGSTFVVELTVDPDKLQLQQAETDLMLADVMGKKTTLDEALKSRSMEQISGTISLSFETDATGQIRHRTKKVEIKIKGNDGRLETHEITETTDRKLVQD
jgi:hypothetical protein